MHVVSIGVWIYISEIRGHIWEIESAFIMHMLHGTALVCGTLSIHARGVQRKRNRTHIIQTIYSTWK